MKPERIIIHHSLTKDFGTVSWGVIRNYHMVECGWRDIGYHFGIEIVGNHEEILLGRMPNEIGAHCKGYNRSIGICCVGNFDNEPPPEKIWRACRRLVRWLMVDFEMTNHMVVGHRELASHKSCPGRMFDMDKFRREL